MDQKIESKLIKELKNHRLTIDDMVDITGEQKQNVQDFLDKLQQDNYNLNFYKSPRSRKTLYHVGILPNIGNVYKISDSDSKHKEMHFGVASDLHFASIFHMSKTFHDAMKITEDVGIKKVYVAGDVIDGTNIYKGHLENIVHSSVERQTDIAAEALNKHPNLEFWAIAGNHDYSFTQRAGVKPLAILEQKLDNFKNLGDFRADVVYNGIRLRLLHGAGGRAYATSYPSQTYLRDLFKGMERKDMKDIPHMIMLGHYHTFYFGKDHGIFILQPTSFQDGDNEYCLRRGLHGSNGMFHVNMSYHNKDIDNCVVNYIQPQSAHKEKGKAFAQTTRNYK